MRNLNPLVSIIIPVHNAMNYVQEVVSSCLNQTYSNLEIILVENGSIDESWKVLQNINHQRVKVFQLSEGNASAARNYGYKQSTGQFIIFLDADDCLEKNKIQLQMNVLSELEHDWVASCSWSKFEDSMEDAVERPQPVWTIEDPVDWCINAWNGGGMMIPGCWLIPRKIIERSGLWDERLSLHDDGEFMSRVLLSSKGNKFVDGTTVFYRQVKGSLSRQNKSLKSAESAFLVCQLYEKSILVIKDNKIIRQALATNYYRFIYEFYPQFKELHKKANERIKNLNVQKNIRVGGKQFKLMANFIGFNNALKLRNFVENCITILK